MEQVIVCKRKSHYPVVMGFGGRRLMIAVLCVCAFIMFASTASAKVWKIGTGGDFSGLSAAIKSSKVTEGDELSIIPGTTLEEYVTITKKVSITGPGYLTDQQATLVNGLTIQADGVVVSGLSFGSSTSYPNIYIRGNNILIDRCYLRASIYGAASVYECDNLTVQRCFSLGTIGRYSKGIPEGWTLRNNILANEASKASSDGVDYIDYEVVSNLDNAVIDHNVIFSAYHASNGLPLRNVTHSVLTNNIIMHIGSDPNNNYQPAYFDYIFDKNTYYGENDFRNNLFSGSNFTNILAEKNKMNCNDLQDVFSLVGNMADDTFWQLSVNSPAKGYATDGGDCGPWSGEYPYLIGGVESAPDPGPQPEVGLKGDAILNSESTDNPSTQTYQSLMSLFTAIATQGLLGDLTVKVAPATYYLEINDTSLPVLQVMFEQLTTSGKKLAMTAAPNEAIFNIVLDNSFLVSHATELETILTSIAMIMSGMELTNITIYLNGNPILNDTFQVEANDLLALKTMYKSFDGANWYSKWNFESNGRNKEDFPGVTFNDDGKVLSINLSKNNLVGKLFAIHEPQFSELVELNLSYNSLTGDLGPFAKDLTKLKSLNVNHNKISVLSESIPAYEVFADYQDCSAEEPLQISVTRNKQTIEMPSLFTYNYKSHTFNSYNTMRVNDDLWFYPDKNNQYLISLKQTIYKEAQDIRTLVTMSNGYTGSGSVYPVVLHFLPGDANMDSELDVLDIQYMLNYILAPSTVNYFNFSAANNYNKDDDNIINVQDIVASINLLLGNSFATANMPDDTQSINARMRNEMNESFDCTFYTQTNSIVMQSEKKVSAIDILLEGVTVDEVSLQLDQRDFQMIGRNTEEGARFVVFSPTGKAIPEGITTRLLRTSSNASLVRVQCAGPDAQAVSVQIGTAPTGIVNVMKEHSSDVLYDLNGRRVSDQLPYQKGIYIKNGKKVIVK